MNAFDWQQGSSEITNDLKRLQEKRVKSATKVKECRKEGRSMLQLRINAKANFVEQRSLEGEPIKRFPSVVSAANYHGVTNSAIQAALHGRTKTSCGFKWAFVSGIETQGEH